MSLNDLARDKEGYLSHLTDWTVEVAVEIAQEENIFLTEDHWLVINFLRDFYQKYSITPPMRIIVRELAKQLPLEKGNSLYLQQLFPAGLLRQASKIAGLPKPPKCT